ncbi:hypothetical protein PtA15_5A387 [Puccinia triticina]|uniref:Uncharacterized protein n=1 Tax=Puccinia triticina TaxID=208348 RepID=A0ABY7CI71_9BASI|nr:uncharacterized protein PtA15_5A387 [Puccinia triticina]WAQ84814.1 hypothetical protein PtA15_5A387 [Puccinia triticina]
MQQPRVAPPAAETNNGNAAIPPAMQATSVAQTTALETPNSRPVTGGEGEDQQTPRALAVTALERQQAQDDNPVDNGTIPSPTTPLDGRQVVGGLDDTDDEEIIGAENDEAGMLLF